MSQKNKTVVLLLLLLLALVSCAKEPQPPIADKRPVTDTIFGVEMVDNYQYMRNRDDSAVIAYIEAENAYTDAYLAHTQNLQDTLFAEMIGRIKEDDRTVPVKKDDYYYYSRNETGKEYKIYCRKKGSLEADEEVLLDMNKMAEGFNFMDLGVYAVSPNQKLLAYGLDTAGNERYTLYIKNLETGELYPDAVDSISNSIEWANDNQTLFYVTTDDAWRPYQLFRHKLGDDRSKDVLVYHEMDDSYFLDIGKTRDEKFLLLMLGSNTTSEIHFLDANTPNGKFRVIHPRQHLMEYTVGHHNGYFYIVTNDDAVNFKLMRTKVTRPEKKYWEEVIGHRPEVLISGIDLFENYMVLYERENGFATMHVRDMRTGQTEAVQFPEPVYEFSRESNPEFKSSTVRFNYSSLITPSTIYDYHMDTHELEMMKQTEVLGGYDPNNYQMERVYATASDGTQIPISIVYKKGLVKDGNNPCYLTGYGAYGYAYEPYFSSVRFSLIDRGFIFARAHIRGGGELGRPWYDDGKLLKKKNTFTDFIACSQYLIDQKYTSNQKLVGSGGSAGGLLIGAVANMRPDLYGALVADVPFVDLINTMRDETIPLTVIEWEEWGNPNEKEYFDYMYSYSPYDNVKAQNYPPIFIAASLNDTRVAYWEPTKWTAKLRATKTDCNPLVLYMNMGAGHGGASGRYAFMHELAREFAFVLDVMGIEK